MPAWKIREANLADVPELVELHRELYIAYRDKILDSRVVRLIAYHDFEQILVEDIKFLISHRDSQVLVAEVEGVMVGYVTGRIAVEERRILKKRGIIEDWYLRDDARGLGIGHALLQEVQAFFAANDCEIAEATTWCANKKARELYQEDKWSEIQVLLRKELTFAAR